MSNLGSDDVNSLVCIGSRRLRFRLWRLRLTAFIFLQWIASQDSSGWTFKTTDKTHNVYLGYEGNPSEGIPMVGLANPVPFGVQTTLGSDGIPVVT